MSIELTTRAQAVTQQQKVVNQIVLQIENIPTIYGAIKTTEAVRIGADGLVIGGFVIGGSRELPNSRPYVSLDGTTNNLTSQMRQDKGGENSIQKFTVTLADIGNYVSEEFAPGNFVEDILGSVADIYFSFEGLSFPEDAVKIFNGIIDDVEFNSDSVTLSIAHPETLKRRELFLPHITELSTGIDASTLSIPVNNSAGYKIVEDAYIKTYIRVDDELIRYTSTGGGLVNAVERGALGTVAAAHDADTEVSTVYRLTGHPLTLALGLMLSSSDEYYASNIEVTRIENNRIYINSHSILDEYGTVEGDFLTLENSTNGNDFVKLEITEIGVDSGLAFFEVPQALNDELDLGPKLSIRSKYNIMSEGCAMTPKQVDVAQHELIEDLVGGSFPALDFLLTEEENAKDFISKEIYFPCGMYALNRKARASVGYTLPPVSLFETKILDASNITNAANLKVKRSTGENFYNTVHYKYEQNIITDKFLAGRITTNEDSINRIKSGTKQLVIESRGLRNTPSVNTFLDAQADRFLDRYKFAAESINIELPYQVGFNIELGDRVQINGSEVGLYLYSQGTRDPQAKIFEVTNKSMNIKTGKVSLTCLDTVFGLSGRFATIAPTSIIGVGSTQNRIAIINSFGSSAGDEEYKKWTDFINSKVLVRTEDYSYQEVTVLRDAIDGFLSVETLSSAPAAGLLVDTPSYDEATESFKVLHAYTSPRVFVAVGIDNISFIVSDDTSLFIGATVRVNSPDYSEYETRKIENIAASVVTLDRELSFTPALGYEVNQIGFVADKGDSYLYL